MRSCTKCSKSKANRNFYVLSSQQLHSWCKACCRKDSKIRANLVRESKTPEQLRDEYLKRFYNKSSAWYEEQLKRQGGTCALCPALVPGGMSKVWFCVDHDHSCCSGRYSCGDCVRGLLCSACNTKLGWLENRADTIKKYQDFGFSQSR